MPRITKPERSSTPKAKSQPVTENGPASEVLTLSEAAAYLRFPEADILRLVDEQGLPARRLGDDWRFSRSAIQQWLSTPPPRESKEAQLAVAGAWKHDPYVEAELEEILKRRGRSTEDGE